MKLKILGSSSLGNCYVIENKEESLMIECGINFDKIKRNTDITRVNCVLVSHSHQDHIKSIESLLERGLNVFAHKDTLEKSGTINDNFSRIAEPKKKYVVGGFSFVPFLLEHDVTCLGYLIHHEDMGLLLFATDTATIPYKFKGLNNLMIECNYSEDCINEAIYSHKLCNSLEDRIVNNHLSLESVETFLKNNDLSCIDNIILLHLSDGNSNADIFRHQIMKLTGINTIIADANMEIDISINKF